MLKQSAMPKRMIWRGPAAKRHLLLIAVIMLVGCQPQTEVTRINPWLSTIPSQSVMVLANEKPLTDQQIMRLLTTVVPSLTLIDRSFNAPMLGRGLRWLTSLDDVDAMRSLGIDPNGYWAGYAHDNQLIFHVPLSDTERFEIWWADRGASSKAEMTIHSVASNPNAHQDTASARIEWPLPQAWQGSSQLSSSQDITQTWSAASWSALNQTHQLDGHLTLLLNPRILSIQPSDSEPDCQTLWGEWTEQLPQWIFGTRVLEAHSVSLLMRVLIHDRPADSSPAIDVSSAVQAQVAGFGLAMGATELRAQILDQASTLEALDARCRSDHWGLTARRWTQALANRPLPPVVTSIQGLVSRYEGHRPYQDPVHATQDDKGGLGDYFTEVFLSNPQFMVGLAQLFSADMASMDFSPGQPPKRLPMTLTDPLTDQPVYLSTTERSIRLSADPTPMASTKADEAHEDRGDQPYPWMVATLNLSRLNELDLVLGSNALTSIISPWLAQLKLWGQATRTEKVKVSVTRSDEGVDLVMTIKGTRNPD